jgi:protein-S-isoprenylcysteine O-methyltransferase Ste14
MGPCRYVRNPMYLGFFAGWAGLWVIFGQASVAATAWACVVLAAVALFVALYEQPTLRRKFGADYEEYCRNVRAWIPRMRPWVR